MTACPNLHHLSVEAQAMIKKLFLRSLLCLLAACLLPACSKAQNTEPQPPLKPELTLTHVATLRGQHILSPKSVRFSPDGSRFYVNSLEGLETVVYDTYSLAPIQVIRHEFDAKNASLFLNGETTAFDYEYFADVPEENRNCFGGKPVESAFSHDGRYLWVTYYRRTWDKYANSPSAVAIIDTAINRIVRVIPTGPLPKMIVPSPDGQTMAIIHWGDNSIGLVDIRSANPRDFTYKKLLADGKRLNVKDLKGDRDAVCGFCLRGAAFSADSRYLFVGRMHNGGITVFDLKTMERLGTYMDVDPTPRHLILSQDGKKLYFTSNYAGTVTELDIEELLDIVRKGTGKVKHSRSLSVGKQARTLVQSPDGKKLFVACNRSTELAVVDIKKWQKIATVQTTPFTVGVAVSPNGELAITTSQGRNGKGGHAVDVFRIDPPVGPKPAPAEKPADNSSLEPASHAEEIQAPEGEPKEKKPVDTTPPEPPKRGQDSLND